MSWLDRVRFRLRGVRRRRLEREFDDELHFHLEAAIQAHLARGLDPEQARQAAHRELGVAAVFKADLREARGIHLFDALTQDLRYGLRLLRRSPGFAAAAIVTVALGIGSTTAVFGVVDGVVLRPLAYPQPDRLVSLWGASRSEGLTRSTVAAGPYRDWRALNTSFEDLALVRRIGNFNFTGGGEAVRLQGARVTASLFRVLGVQPALGRPFREEDEQQGQDLQVILSDGLWVRYFGRDPAVVGRTIVLNSQPHRVVGVMPPEFHYPSRDFELWVPLAIPAEEIQARVPANYVVVGRLRPGVGVAAAQAEMDAIASRLATSQRAFLNDVEVVLLRDDLIGPVRTPLLVLLAGALGLLLIGCATLANLLIARASSRAEELVLRSVLGARRGRLVRQALTELLPIMAAGGALGVLVAWWLLDVTRPLLPPTMPRVENVAIDVRVLGFSGAALTAILLAVGAWPALQVARRNTSAAPGSSPRGASAARPGVHVRDALVVSQIATALLLAVSAALLMRSLAGISRIDPGFRTEGVATLHLAIPRAKYADDHQVAALCRDILARVRQVPGIDAAGMVNRLPLAGGTQIGMLELERSVLALNRIDNLDWRTASPDYFKVLGIPLLEGRTFTDADHAGAPPVGIVDARLAHLAWPHESAVGKRFRIPIDGYPWVTVIGVVGHLRHDSLTVDARVQVYWNYLQRGQDRMALVARTSLNPDAMTRSLIAAIRDVDPEQPVYDARPMSAVVDRSLSDRWLTTSVLGAFAGVALLMAAIGVYGVVSYAAGQRAREFGIRMALGASPREVMQLVIRRGAALVTWGLAIGLGGAVLATRLLAQLLHGISRTDWISFTVAALVLTAAALAATIVPARRAVQVDPMSVLRH
jgi:predicted permease